MKITPWHIVVVIVLFFSLNEILSMYKQTGFASTLLMTGIFILIAFGIRWLILRNKQ